MAGGSFEFDKAIALLGRQVTVYMDINSTDPQSIVTGRFLSISDSGEFCIEDDSGFVHYCWPMLAIEPSDTDG